MVSMHCDSEVIQFNAHVVQFEEHPRQRESERLKPSCTCGSLQSQHQSLQASAKALGRVSEQA